MTSTVFVTGGNRGIGLEIVRGYAKAGCKVLLGCRDEEEGNAAKEDIVGADIQVIEIDLNNPASIAESAIRAEAVFGGVDILVNNAGVLKNRSWEEMLPEELSEAFQVHVAGPLTLIRQFLPGMVNRGFGRIVNVSSEYGAFSKGMQGPLAYSVTKAALNALTVNLARQIDQNNIKINAMCPGWVHTRMGGKDAPRSPEQGAETAIWLGLLDEDGPTGKFFHDKKEMEW